VHERRGHESAPWEVSRCIGLKQIPARNLGNAEAERDTRKLCAFLCVAPAPWRWLSMGAKSGCGCNAQLSAAHAANKPQPCVSLAFTSTPARSAPFCSAQLTRLPGGMPRSFRNDPARTRTLRRLPPERSALAIGRLGGRGACTRLRMRPVRRAKPPKKCSSPLPRQRRTSPLFLGNAPRAGSPRR
jgi:hypothetical protein